MTVTTETDTASEIIGRVHAVLGALGPVAVAVSGGSSPSLSLTMPGRVRLRCGRRQATL